MIDEFLRNYEFSAAYEILIDTPPSVVYQSLLASYFSHRWLARLVIALRTRKWMTRSPEEFEQRARRARGLLGRGLQRRPLLQTPSRLSNDRLNGTCVIPNCLTARVHPRGLPTEVSRRCAIIPLVTIMTMMTF